MAADLQTWVWLGAGAALLLSEFVLPGLVAAFLGAAALTVGGLRYAGVLDSFAASSLTFAVLSGAYVWALRGSMLRWFGTGETSRETTDENVRLFGRVVEVVDGIDGSAAGRIRLDGTTWPAHTLDGSSIARGQQARIVHRDNIGWVVESTSSSSAIVPASPVALTNKD